jgi:hypothetical protein
MVLILSTLKLDRMSLFSADLLRSGFLSLVTALVLWFNKRKICSKHSDNCGTFDGFRFVL